jgi:hypothetical protein
MMIFHFFDVNLHYTFGPYRYPLNVTLEVNEETDAFLVTNMRCDRW